jgi:hypothetical protein
MHVVECPGIPGTIACPGGISGSLGALSLDEFDLPGVVEQVEANEVFVVSVDQEAGLRDSRQHEDHCRQKLPQGKQALRVHSMSQLAHDFHCPIGSARAMSHASGRAKLQFFPFASADGTAASPNPPEIADRTAGFNFAFCAFRRVYS